MNYTQTLKNELVTLQAGKHNACCKLAFLSAAIRGCGSLVLSSSGREISLTSASLPLINFLQHLSATFFPSCYTVINAGVQRVGSNSLSELVLFSAEEALKKCHIAKTNPDGSLELIQAVPLQILANECCCRCYLRGLIAASGTVSLPMKKQSSGYHLELNLSSSPLAQSVLELISSLGFHARLAKRDESFVVYIKDSETISDFLAYLGASNAVITMQSLIVEKEFNNRINRKVNVETHNLDKSLTASVKHTKIIDTLKQNGGYDKLPPKLMQLCRAREENPTATLDELARLMCISKSAVNHRFRNLAKIAKSAVEPADEA